MPARMTAPFKLDMPVVTEEQARRARAFEAYERREKWRQRLRDSGIPTMYHGARLADCDEAIRSYASAFSDETSRGLLITGPYGSGKTHAACAVLAIVAREHPVLFATMPEVVNQAATFERDALSRYRNTRLLCLDDLGKERPTEFAMEQVYTIIDYRWREGKPTIITTNHDAVGLRAHFEKIADAHTAKAIMSRILGMCDVVKMMGADRRLS